MVPSRTTDRARVRRLLGAVAALTAALAAGCTTGLEPPGEAPRPSPDGPVELGRPLGTPCNVWPPAPSPGEVLLAELEATGVWPFYSRVAIGDAYERRDILAPFITMERRGSERTLTVRPLFRSQSDGESHSVQFLWPLGLWSSSPRSARLTLFPVIYYRRKTDEDSTGVQIDRDFSLFPLVFAGTDTREGDYFALFPLGGMLKGVLGKRYVRFFAFPAWLETECDWYHAWHFPWPVMGVWKGERQAGWRVWPLAGVDRRQGKFERRFLLWPLLHWWHVGLDTKYPTDAFLLFPLWGHVHNANTDHVTVLWPFFSRRTEKDRRLLEVHAPWPFFGVATADGLDALKVWPLWGERRSNLIRHRFVLWPLYRTKSERLSDLRLTTRNLGVLYWSVEREWVELADSSGRVRCFAPPRGGADRWMEDPRPSADVRFASEAEISRRVAAGEGVYRRAVTRRLWPLAHSRAWADGSREFRMLSPLPLAVDRYPGEDLYAPLYSLYGYSRSADGTRRESAALGLYRHERNALARHVNVLGLTDYLRVGTERKRWRLLGGFIEYERDGNQKGFRFLWIPFKRIRSDSGEVAKQGE